MGSIEKIEEIEIAKLKPYAKNAKKHGAAQVEKLKASIQEFGFLTPCLIDKEFNLIAGHGRLAAAKELQLEKVPCVFVEGLSDDQRRAYILADNRLGELGEWDMELVESELKELQNMNFDIDLTGFDIEDFKIELPKTEEDDFSEELPEEPKSKLGDFFRLGKHRLICGDSLDDKVVKKLTGGGIVDLLFTDPPYQLETSGGGILKNANSMKQIKQNRVDSFDPSKLNLWCKTNIFCHNKPLIKDYIVLAEKNNQPYDLAFYKKMNSVPNYKGHLMTDVEYIAIIGNQDPNKGLSKEFYSKCFIGRKDKDNALSYSKPLALCEKYILLYSSNSVMDLFGGSGSTLIACEQLGKTCFMSEKDPRYIDVIIDRWEKLTGQKAELIQET